VTRARGLTLAQVRKLPATVDVPTAALALGISRSTLYEWIRIGQSPVKAISVRRRVVVITADLLRVLEGDQAGAA
jgi:predicted site-specific integrase-resolvase